MLATNMRVTVISLGTFSLVCCADCAWRSVPGVHLAGCRGTPSLTRLPARARVADRLRSSLQGENPVVV